MARWSAQRSDGRKSKRRAPQGVLLFCPNCGKEFVPDSQLDLSPEEIRGVVAHLDEEIEKSVKKQERLEQQLKKLRREIMEAERSNDRKNELTADRKKYERSMKSAKEEKFDLQDEIGKREERIRKLKKENKNKSLIQNIEAQIKSSEDERKQVVKRIEVVNDDIYLIKFWQFNMGKLGFLTALANRSVKIIEGITNSYLRKFGTDISVLINGFKILKDGSVREKIDVFVTNDGITAEQFMSKSGGERGRVTLAGILGIQHLINLSLNGKGMNLLLLDEVFPGVDAMGQEKIIKVLENMGITIMLITQNVSESFNNENTLYVIKENGVSRYV